MRRDRPCPFDILTRVQAWGWSAANVEKVYPYYARAFNSPTIAQAIAINGIAQVEQPITLRGVFYRAVSAGIYPDTGDQWYRQCGNIVLKLRRAGLLDYRALVDSTRRRLKPSSWSGLADYADTVARAYRKDLWARQGDYIEVFVEKDAMAAVIEPVTQEYDIPLNVIRGCVSESFVWQIAQLWREIEKPITAYYLGDHDPAGLMIEDDICTRLADMTMMEFEWERLAITGADFRSNLLGFPIKGERTKKGWRTRNGDYLAKYGDRCVEVDALPASDIRERIRQTIERHIDQEEWSRLKVMEALERESVKKFALAQRMQAEGTDE